MRFVTCGCCEASFDTKDTKPVRAVGNIFCPECAKNSLHLTPNEARLLIRALESFIQFQKDILDPHSGLNKKERRTATAQLIISKIVIQRLRGIKK